ncbi:hypothetical protein ACIGEP_12075 [Microbacterium sp. NPDC077663]|uniref:hypothetical protein n=1 Tax=Microbacterium sp. NPDC077663 TaxID=3364189 RepID=UPI0037CB31E1
MQIAYGADSRVQSLLAVTDATGSEGFEQLAAMQAAWFFGANHAGQRMYDPATGVTYDGLQPDGTVNRNSGAESTIHGLLTAIALDAHPDVRDQAVALTQVTDREGLAWVEAEDAVSTTGEIDTPESWTGESSWSGDRLTLSRGDSAVFDLGESGAARWIEPVIWSEVRERTASTWRANRTPLGSLQLTGPAQGISPTPGAMHPHTLTRALAATQDRVRVEVTRGDLQLDGLLVRPIVSRLDLGGDGAGMLLVHSAARTPQRVTVGSGEVSVYDARGREVRVRQGSGTVTLPAGGFAIVER